MSKHEVKIVAKIIRELSLFLMLHGYKHYTIETKLEDQITYFILRFEGLKDAVLEKMKEKLLREREMEVETYGWELLGDIDSQSELEIVGLFIDDMKIETTDNQTVITLTRKNRYKEGN